MRFFSDRFRTMVNIVADSLGAGIVSELVKNEKKQDNSRTYEMVDMYVHKEIDH